MTDAPPDDGPLSALMAGLADEDDRAPGPIHHRVLELPEGDGRSWTIACFDDPGGARALHALLRRVIEATLLAELSSPPDLVAELHGRPPSALRVILFADVPEADRAVRAFGLRPVAPTSSEFRTALARFRGEVARHGDEPPDTPAAVFEVAFAATSRAVELEAELLKRTGDEVWGASPGAPTARLLSLVGTAVPEAFGAAPPPTTATISDVEAALGATTPGTIRWLPPMVFQAMCDLAGVAAARELGCAVDWAECVPDDDGLSPPPLLRTATGAGHVHVPIALELLRWSVMPREEGDDVAPFGQRVQDLFS